MPPSPWVPKLWGPVCILTPTPNIRAPIRLQGGGLLAAGGCGVRVEASPQPAGAAGPRRKLPPVSPTPLPTKAQPPRRGRLFSSRAGGAGSRISKPVHPLLPRAGPTPTFQVAFQNWRGPAPGESR